MRSRKHVARAEPHATAAPLWYKDAIIYELSVRALCDRDADGIGDFRGLTTKLDYLQDLGVTGLWLLPFYPSPGLDDGYDITDYTNVHPAYGTLQDFKAILREAHRRGLRVITELVLNHTSDQHPWFQRARRAKPGSCWRDFYVWSQTPEKYQGVRIIFQDFDPSNWSWDPGAKAYYWHRFYAHQPDLNYDNPRVLVAIRRVVDFWLRLGVDGLRLDAVPYLAEAEDTPSENLPPTHAILRQLRRHVDRQFTDRILLAEVNQWPEAAATYFGRGDECHMAFHFPLMPRLFMALHTEDRFPLVDILAQTPPIPETCQWALFLRNHDELYLSAFRGLVVFELFGRTAFPPINERPYMLTLAPYAFHWFALESPRVAATPLSMTGTTPPMPTPTASGPWEAVLEGKAATGVEEALRGYLQQCRWFGGRGERILSMKLVEAVAVTEKTTPAYLTLYQVEYAGRDSEIYVLPLAFAAGAHAEGLLCHYQQAVIARLRLPGPGGRARWVLYDAMWEPRFVHTLLAAIVRHRRLRGQAGTLLAHQWFAPMLELARRLGQRTAELHLTLAAETGDPASAPEPLTALDRRPLYQSLRNLTLPVFQTLRQHWPTLARAARPSSRPTARQPPRVPCCPRRMRNCRSC